MFLLFFIPIFPATTLAQNNACSRLYDYPLRDIRSNCYINPNVNALTPQMIKQNGYTFLSYNVTTPDGYNLQLFRIPASEKDNRANKQPVLLEHGLFHDSSSWTFVGNRSLAFNLAERGYDVWLANQRGTRYSRGSKRFKTNSFEYWNFSLDTLAANDIPTFLRAVADITGKAGSIVYIGHSRGTTLMFMYASENPLQAQNLLRGVIALSPIVYFDMAWYFQKLMSLIPTLGRALLSWRIPVIFYNLDEIFDLMLVLCSNFPYFCRLCIDLTSGTTWQFLPDDLLTLYTHSPSSESILLIIQYAQMAMSGRFQKFDFGKVDNFKKYGYERPPLYQLEKIQVPVFMFYGQNDILVKQESISRIFNELGSTEKAFWNIPDGDDDWEYQFNHNDFVWAKYLDELLYSQLFHILDTKLKMK